MYLYVQFHAMLHICVVSIDQNSVGQWICISSGPPDFLFCLHFVEAVVEKKIEEKFVKLLQTKQTSSKTAAPLQLVWPQLRALKELKWYVMW